MWIYEGKPVSREDLARSIQHRELRAGWIVGEHEWVWVRLVKEKDGSVIRCEKEREPTPEEKRALEAHLQSGAICRRVLRTREQPRWALASID